MPKKEKKNQDFPQRRLRVDSHALGHHGAMLQIQIRDERVCAFDCKLSFKHIDNPELQAELVAIGEGFEGAMDDAQLDAPEDMDKYLSAVVLHLGQLMDAIKRRMT